MKLNNQYLAQAVNVASNSLRLSTEKIEMVGVLRELLLDSPDLDVRLKHMKKITAFSRVAIRLDEIHRFLMDDRVDFLKITDLFKLHSQSLVRDINGFIEENSLFDVKNAIQRLNELESVNISIPSAVPAEETAVNMPLELEKAAEAGKQKKERYIFEDEPAEPEMLFQNYEQAVMRPIKAIDALLKKMPSGEVLPDEYIQYAKIMKTNAALSEKFGTEIIAGMHKIVCRALILIKNRELMPGKEVIEALRACLIVIAALVKSKEVDITTYLNRAEDFGQKIQSIKS